MQILLLSTSLPEMGTFRPPRQAKRQQNQCDGLPAGLNEDLWKGTAASQTLRSDPAPVGTNGSAA